MSRTCTRAPAFSNAFTVAAPMPLAPPVTMATLSLRLSWKIRQIYQPALARTGQVRAVSAPMRALLITAALGLCVARAADAQQFVVPYTGTLKKINESGVLRLGHRENSPPFAFLNARGRPIGYSLDLCAVVVEEIAAE